MQPSTGMAKFITHKILKLPWLRTFCAVKNPLLGVQGGAISSSVQGLLLSLCFKIAPRRVCGSYGVPGIKPVNHIQDKCSACCTFKEKRLFSLISLSRGFFSYILFVGWESSLSI